MMTSKEMSRNIFRVLKVLTASGVSEVTAAELLLYIKLKHLFEKGVYEGSTAFQILKTVRKEFDILIGHSDILLAALQDLFEKDLISLRNNTIISLTQKGFSTTVDTAVNKTLTAMCKSGG